MLCSKIRVSQCSRYVVLYLHFCLLKYNEQEGSVQIEIRETDTLGSVEKCPNMYIMLRLWKCFELIKSFFNKEVSVTCKPIKQYFSLNPVLCIFSVHLPSLKSPPSEIISPQQDHLNRISCCFAISDLFTIKL